jgi:hypothetical protein
MPLDAAVQSVTATLNYLGPIAEKPTRYVDEPPAGRPRWNGLEEPHEVPIIDGRARAGAFTLDRNGFALLQAPTTVRNFYDANEITSVYYSEAEALLRRTLGAARVVVFDHIVRNATRFAQGKAKEPVLRVHNDYTYRSAPKRVRDLLGDEADELLRHRFAIVNVWRPIRGPVLDSPLALCDAASFTDADLVPSDLVYRDRVGEITSVRFNPTHRWYYFSRMQPDEALLIKCHDSATDGRARLSFHTAFKDPTVPADAPPRESIELRTLVFFPPVQ